MTKSFHKAWIAAGTFCFVPVQHLGVIPLLTSGCCSIFWDLLKIKSSFFFTVIPVTMGVVNGEHQQSSELNSVKRITLTKALSCPSD